jgi:hypothetical protein
MDAPSTHLGKALYFVNVLGDTHPMCLDWTKVGVALSTCFTVITGGMTAIQQAVDAGAHTSWGLFGAAIGLHGLSHGAYRAKRYLEKDQ